MRVKQPPPKIEKQFNAQELADGIRKLQRRLEDVRAIDPVKVRYNDPIKILTEQNIQDTIRSVFGSDSPEFGHHQYHEIWHGNYVIGGQPHFKQNAFAEGLKDTQQMLESLISRLKEKREDLPPEVTPAGVRIRDLKFGVLDAPPQLKKDLEGEPGALGMALIYLDIDSFKSVNTRFTETIVDQQVLPVFQRNLLAWVGCLGRVYAEGGDEVVVLLPNATVEIANALAEELVCRVRRLSFLIQGQTLTLTISAGVAVARDGTEMNDLQLRANDAKRTAKETGKNKVVVHGVQLRK